MRPFEPNVEAALLTMLRNIKVWPCFMKSNRKIGRLGTRVRGYWESKATCTTLKNSVKSVYPGRIARRSRQITRGEFAHLQCMWLKFQKVAGYVHPENSVPPLWFLKYYRETGLVELKHFNMIKWKLPYSDTPIFFSRNFILPIASQRHFSKDKPIGRVVGDTKTLSIVDEDDVAREIYRGSINGRSSLSLRINPVQAVKVLQFTPEILHSTNEVWTRSLERRNDGTVVVLLNHYFALPGCPTSGLVEFQDVTDEYMIYL